MNIGSFKYVPREEFTQDQDINTSAECIGILLYKVSIEEYWIELRLNGFVVNDGLTNEKFYTLEDAYKALCVFIAENI